MVLAYHVVFGTYGFWLPNDPRGSWSDFVGSWELFRFGAATKTDTRRSVAHVPHDRRLRTEAKAALKYPPVRLSGRQALAVARGFQRAAGEGAYAVHACCVLPEHVHLVLGRHPRPVERVVRHLKGRATQQLLAEGLWPANGRPVWARRCWKVFLNRHEDVRRAVAYVEQNPVREGHMSQRWSFVVPYPGIDGPV